MDFTAHIREQDEKIQTVFEHSNGVSKLAEKYAENLNLSNIAKLQGLVHDFGKLCNDFNDYIYGKNKFVRGDIDHSYAGGKYLFNLAKLKGNAETLETACFIARTVFSHHGLHDWVSENGEDYFTERMCNSKRFNEIESNIKKFFSEDEILLLLEKAEKEYSLFKIKIKSICTFTGKPDLTYFSFYIGLFERLMQSVLIDADRTDTSSFMCGKSTESVFDIDSVWNSMKSRMDEKCNLFRLKSDSISKQRMSISDRCAEFAKNTVGACKLIVPTGGGKTLSSLRFAIEYCRFNKKEKIFYVAPFMSILEQNSDIIREFVPDDELFLEHHSNASEEINKYEELKEYELRTEKWDVPVISTTFVQFLNSIYLGKTSSIRRFHRLCNSVIIIDEIQSLPIKCIHLFNLAVNFLTKICESTVVLCSATQPNFQNLEYPLILDDIESMTGDVLEDFKRFKRTEIIPELITGGYTFSKASDFCIDKFKLYENLLLIVNTKKAALEIFKDLSVKNKTLPESKRAQIIHLSTNMCPQHRREKIAYMKSLLKNKKRVICITTQLIEAGVDISFKCVVRSIAGMDNAAQAAGRCNRNGEYDCAPVYIINIYDENLGSLDELKTAQSISRRMIDSKVYSDMLSVKTMSDYFDKYYFEQSEKLSFPVIDASQKTTLINLLSKNKIRTGGSKYITKYTNQAFSTAGKLFGVIDSNTLNIIVPYNEEAKKIIADLEGDIEYSDFTQLFRKAQKYIVGIYNNFKLSLEENKALVFNEKYGVFILKDGYYDKDIGIVIDGAEKELLIF